MNSIVLDLQKEAMDSNVAITDLLRKAFFVAKKLKIEEFEEWINSELDGYNVHDSDIPPYRDVKGVLKCKNPFSGQYENFTTGNFELDQIISKKVIGNSIVELEDLYTKSEFIAIDVFSNMQFLKQKLNMQIVPEVLVITNTKLKAIFDSVRKIILEWALKLEEDDILGKGLTFTKKEKETVKENIKSYINIVNSQVQMNTSNSIQIFNNMDLKEVKSLIDYICGNLKDLKLTKDSETEIKDEISTIKHELSNSNPNKSKIGEGLKSMRKILESSSGVLLAQGAIFAISKLLGS